MDLDLLVYVGFVTGLPLNVMGELKLSIGMDLTDCWDELRVSAALRAVFSLWLHRHRIGIVMSLLFQVLT